jgi:hypothetical protein
MCGRARLSSDVSEIKIAFGIPSERPTPNFAASWNVAPTDPLPVVRYDAKDHQRSLEVMRWGLIPYWAKDEKIGFSTINARAEDVDTKPAFREPYHPAERIVRGTPQPDAGGAEAGGLAAMARRAVRGTAAGQGTAGPLPVRRHDLLAGQPARRQRGEQRSELSGAD